MNVVGRHRRTHAGVVPLVANRCPPSWQTRRRAGPLFLAAEFPMSGCGSAGGAELPLAHRAVRRPYPAIDRDHHTCLSGQLGRIQNHRRVGAFGNDRLSTGILGLRKAMAMRRRSIGGGGP